MIMTDNFYKIAELGLANLDSEQSFYRRQRTSGGRWVINLQ